MNTPWHMVEHNWEETSLYDSTGRRVCRFSIHDLGDVTESNQERYEALLRQKVLFVLDVINNRS